jgi:mRNA interferase RelE/StbE
MKLVFKSSFERDIKKIADKELLSMIKNVISNVEFADNVNDIAHLRKLVNFKSFYRLKVKDYRIGLNIDNGTVYFVRFLHRKDIYRVFP